MPEQPFGPEAEDPTPDPASDAAFDSLRKADPVARDGAHDSDDAAIREHVRSRLADQAAPPPRRPWLAVAAAAAAAVVLAGGGYWVGAAVTDRPTQTADSGSLTSSQSTVEARVAGVPESAPQQGPLPVPMLDGAGAGDQSTRAESGADKQLAIWSGRTQFSQEGLSAEVPADAEVSAINPRPADPAVLAAVAAVVGIQGEVQDTSTEGFRSWTIGAQDGTGPNGFLDGSGSLSVNDPAAWQGLGSCGVGVPEPAVDPVPGSDGTGGAGTDGDAPVDSGTADSGTVDSGTGDSSAAGDAVAPTPDLSILPVEPCEPTEPLPALDRTAAEETIRSVLTAAGLDAAAYTITWNEDMGDGQSWATVDPAWAPGGSGADAARMAVWVPGSWSFNWVGNTFAGANGQPTDLAVAGSYPLISPVQAVERLSDPRFGQPTLVAQPEGTDLWQPTPPGTFTGGPIPWPVAQVTITGAELQPSTLSLNNGVTLLAPTYRLSTADGFVWEVSGLADSAFDFAG